MIVRTKRHTLYEWSAESKVDPIAVSHAKRVYLWSSDGKRYLDFNSQLMCVNIGHGDGPVARPFASRRLRSCTPTRSWRPRLAPGPAAKFATITTGDIDTFFFTNGLVPPDGYLEGRAQSAHETRRS